MIFQEYKTKNADGEIHYLCEDVFGIIELYAKEKLDAETLDQLVVHILQLTTPQGDINITYGKSNKQLAVRYTFKGANKWGEDSNIESTV